MTRNQTSSQAMTKTYIEPEDVTLLEKAATNLRDILLIRLLFRLGCRVSEALALPPISFSLVTGQGRLSILPVPIILRRPASSS